jgi:hypothetical protein
MNLKEQILLFFLGIVLMIFILRKFASSTGTDEKFAAKL